MSQFLFQTSPVSLPSPTAPFAFNVNETGEFCNKIRVPRLVDTTPYGITDTNVQVDSLLEVNDYIHTISNGIIHNFTGTNLLSPRERQFIELGTQIVAVSVDGDFVDITLSKSVLEPPTITQADNALGFIFCAQKFFDVSRKGAISIDATKPQKVSSLVPLFSTDGFALEDDFGNALVAESSIALVDRIQASSATLVNITAGTQPLKVAETFPTTSEVSSSLLGIPRAEQQLSLFSDVSTLGLDEFTWEEFKTSVTTLRPPVTAWEERKTRDSQRFNAKLIEDTKEQALALTAFPVPYTYPYDSTTSYYNASQYTKFYRFILLGNFLFEHYKNTSFRDDFLDPANVTVNENTGVLRDSDSASSKAIQLKYSNQNDDDADTLVDSGSGQEAAYRLIDIWTDTFIKIRDGRYRNTSSSVIFNLLYDDTIYFPIVNSLNALHTNIAESVKDVDAGFPKDKTQAMARGLTDFYQPGYSWGDDAAETFVLQTKESYRYQPGRVSGFTFGSRADVVASSAGTKVEWGVQNKTDSYVFRLTGGNLSIVRRSTLPLSNKFLIDENLVGRQATIENEKDDITGLIKPTFYELELNQTDWNVDPLNGNGPSGYQVNPKNVTMWKIEFSWYGAVGAKFYAYIPVGNGEARWVLLHTLVIENKLLTACLEDPFFRMKYSFTLRNRENSEKQQFVYKYGSSVYIDGGDDGTKKQFSYSGDKKNAINNTYVPLLAIKAKANLKNRDGIDIANRKIAYPESLNVSSSEFTKFQVVECEACPGYGYTYDNGLIADQPYNSTGKQINFHIKTLGAGGFGSDQTQYIKLSGKDLGLDDSPPQRVGFRPIDDDSQILIPGFGKKYVDYASTLADYSAASSSDKAEFLFDDDDLGPIDDVIEDGGVFSNVVSKITVAGFQDLGTSGEPSPAFNDLDDAKLNGIYQQSDSSDNTSGWVQISQTLNDTPEQNDGRINFTTSSNNVGSEDHPDAVDFTYQWQFSDGGVGDDHPRSDELTAGETVTSNTGITPFAIAGNNFIGQPYKQPWELTFSAPGGSMYNGQTITVTPIYSHINKDIRIKQAYLNLNFPDGMPVDTPIQVEIEFQRTVDSSPDFDTPNDNDSLKVVLKNASNADTSAVTEFAVDTDDTPDTAIFKQTLSLTTTAANTTKINISSVQDNVMDRFNIQVIGIRVGEFRMSRVKRKELRTEDDSGYDPNGVKTRTFYDKKFLTGSAGLRIGKITKEGAIVFDYSGIEDRVKAIIADEDSGYNGTDALTETLLATAPFSVNDNVIVVNRTSLDGSADTPPSPNKEYTHFIGNPAYLSSIKEMYAVSNIKIGAEDSEIRFLNPARRVSNTSTILTGKPTAEFRIAFTNVDPSNNLVPKESNLLFIDFDRYNINRSRGGEQLTGSSDSNTRAVPTETFQLDYRIKKIPNDTGTLNGGVCSKVKISAAERKNYGSLSFFADYATFKADSKFNGFTATGYETEDTIFASLVGKEELLVVEDQDFLDTAFDTSGVLQIQFAGGEFGLNGIGSGINFETNPVYFQYLDNDGVTQNACVVQLSAEPSPGIISTDNLTLSFVELKYTYNGNGTSDRSQKKIFGFDPFPLYPIIFTRYGAQINNINFKKGNIVSSPSWTLYGNDISVYNPLATTDPGYIANADATKFKPENFIEQDALSALLVDTSANKRLRKIFTPGDPKFGTVFDNGTSAKTAGATSSKRVRTLTSFYSGGEGEATDQSANVTGFDHDGLTYTRTSTSPLVFTSGAHTIEKDGETDPDAEYWVKKTNTGGSISVVLTFTRVDEGDTHGYSLPAYPWFNLNGTLNSVFSNFLMPSITDSASSTPIITDARFDTNKIDLTDVFGEDRFKVIQDIRDSRAIFIVGDQANDDNPRLGTFQASVNTSEI
jgi:hypothetical protein